MPGLVQQVRAVDAARTDPVEPAGAEPVSKPRESVPPVSPGMRHRGHRERGQNAAGHQV